jgi:RNA-binding protein YhbY
MTFKTWISDLKKVQSIIDNISEIHINIDGGTNLLNAESLNAMKTAVSGLSKEQALLVLSTKNLNTAQQEQVLLAAGIISSENKITATAVSQALAKTQLSATEKEALLTKLGLIDATNGEAIANATCTKEELLKVLATKGIVGADAEAIVASIGLTTATGAQTVSIDLLTASIWANVQALGAWLISNPVGWCILAAGAITGVVVAYNHFTESLEEAQEKASKSKEVYDSTVNEIKSLNDELKTTKDRINELQNKDSLTFSEEDELEKLKKTNDELERELRIKEAIAQTEGQQAAKDASNAITKKSEKYNEQYKYGDADTYMQYADNEYTYSQGDRIDAAQWKIDQAKQNNKELEDLYAKRKEIEDKYNNDASQFQNDSEWKANEDNINSKKAYIELVEKQAAEYIKALMNEDDALYDSNGKVIKGQEDLVNRLKALYGNYDEYNQGETHSDTFVKHLQEKGISENIANEIKSQLTDNEIEKVSTLDISPYIDENVTTETVRKAIAKAQEEADKKPIEESISYDDPTDLFRDSTDKDRQSSTANLADLKNGADLLKTIQSEIKDSGNIGIDTMQKITKLYPEAKKALSDYLQGIITQEELFNKLQSVYETDKDNYIKHLVEMSSKDEEFFNTMRINYPELFNELGRTYGTDVDNWTNMEQAKVNISAKAIEQIAALYKQFYDAMGVENGLDFEAQVSDAARRSNAPGAIFANRFNTGFTKDRFNKVATDTKYPLKLKNGKEVTKPYKEFLDTISSIEKKAEDMKNALDDAGYKQIGASMDLDWQGLGKDPSSSGSSSSSDKSKTKQDFNWVERLLSKISKAYDRLKNKVADTTRTWLNRNNALSDSMETLLSEINAQSDAYDFYMDRFNSYDLDGYYKDQIANGSFNIDTVYDEDLKDAISDCQDLYDKAQDAADSVQSLNIEIRQLAKSRFDNIQSQFEEVLGKVNSIKDLYSKDNDLLEEQGWFASTLLNSSMIEQEQKNLAKLEQERDALTKALNSAMESGKIEAESEDWYSMQSAIDDCTSSIYDAKKALVEYDNAIRQINWDAFDRTRNDVSNLIDETQFLVDLLKDEDITDDNGNMNDNGKAAQALIAQKYQLYLNQAKAYKDEILKINEELVNDPYDKELLDRKQELIKAQQDAINSSISEKDALKDLVQEGYDTFLDKLDEVIQKYKDLMSQQKDAYDYEKSIAEKTKALNALEKQYSAVQGDNSEEGKKNIQQLKDQINTAKDDLKDTEYEKLLSDTQAILDNLADTTKTWLDERLDSFDITMQEIIDQSNENASNISQTITDTAENYGYKLSESMSNIWSTNASNITNGINSVLGDFSNKFVEGNNAINKVCGDINAAVQGLLKNSNDEAQRVADEIARQQAEQNANTDGGYSDGGGSSDSGDDWSDNWDNSDSGSSDDGGSWGDWFYHLEDDYPKDLLEVD